MRRTYDALFISTLNISHLNILNARSNINIFSYGRLTTNLCGNSKEEYSFNAKDENLSSKSHCNGRETKFMYENHELVSQATEGKLI